MIQESFPVGLLQCNCTIFGDEASREAIVVDPGDNIDRVLLTLAKHGLTLKMIVVTHGHIDHIGGAAKLRKATGAPVYMHPDDQMLADHLDVQAQWLGVETPENPGIDTPLTEGDRLRFGAHTAEVIHTPGHTQGSVSLYLPEEKLLAAGDTLFAGSIGRTDLPGGDSSQILRSIRGKLFRLPDDTAVIAGHGGRTTIGREKRSNPFAGAGAAG